LRSLIRSPGYDERPRAVTNTGKKSPPIAELIAKKKELLLTERKQLDADGLTAALSFAEYCQVLDKLFQVSQEGRCLFSGAPREREEE
jgi:hypothetical protein